MTDELRGALDALTPGDISDLGSLAQEYPAVHRLHAVYHAAKAATPPQPSAGLRALAQIRDAANGEHIANPTVSLIFDIASAALSAKPDAGEGLDDRGRTVAAQVADAYNHGWNDAIDEGPSAVRHVWPLRATTDETGGGKT